MDSVRLITGVTSPISHIRGAGRICKVINQSLLSMGVAPIQIVRMRDGTQIRVDLRSQTEWFAFYSRSYDDSNIALIIALLNRLRGNFLDVGGNIGMYAVRVAAKLPNANRTICFEPMPANVERIKQNVALNKLGNRVAIYELALSDREGKAELVLREDFEMGSETGNASIAISESADQSFKKIEIRTRRFDDLFRTTNLGYFPVAKVDIEGHEDFFLSGATEYLNRDRPIIFSEINNWFYKQRGTTSSDVFASKFPSGYQVALLQTGRSDCTLTACSMSDLAKLSKIETCVFFPEERRVDLDQSLRRLS